MLQFVSTALVQAWRKQNCIGPPYRYKYLSVNISVYTQKLGRSGGMLPQEIFFYLMLAMASEAIFGLKTSLLIFALVLAW